MLAVVPDYSGSSCDDSDVDDKDFVPSKKKSSTDVSSSVSGEESFSVGTSLFYTRPTTSTKEESYKDKEDSKSLGELENIPTGWNRKQWQRFLFLQSRKDEELEELSSARDCPQQKKRRKNRKRLVNLTDAKNGDGETDTELQVDPSKRETSNNDQRWETLKSYLDINDHLKGSQVDHGDLAPKSGLQKEIDAAISEGDMEKAEELSDQLSRRDFACRIAKAADARDYDKRKKEEEERKSAVKKQKRHKLRWGFEVKHRWEMKGNM